MSKSSDEYEYTEQELDDIYNREWINMIRSRDTGRVKYDMKYMCDICKKNWAISEWFVMTHKYVEHGIRIPPNYKG